MAYSILAEYTGEEEETQLWNRHFMNTGESLQASVHNGDQDGTVSISG